MKAQNARMGALSKLMDLLDSGDTEDMRKPFGDAGDKSPLEKSGMEGAVDPATSFAKGGEVDGDGKDEGSDNEFASSWEALTGKSFRRSRDQEGLGGESAMDGAGKDAASLGDEDMEMSDEDKAKLSAAYHRHVLGKR